MAPLLRARPMRKDAAQAGYKVAKISTFAESVQPLRHSAPNIRCVSWSPLGDQLAACTSINIRVWNPERPEVRASTELKDGRSAHMSAVEKVAFNPRSDALLASTGLDGLVKVWDVRVPAGAVGFAGGGPNGRGTTTAKSGEYKIGDKGMILAWHPAGSGMLVGRSDGVVQAVDVRRLDVATEVAGSTTKYELSPTDCTPSRDIGKVCTMAFSNSGNEVFATTAEGPVHILDYPTMQPIHTIYGHTSSTYAVQQSPIGNYIAVGGDDSLVTLWDTDSWLCTQVLSQHTMAVHDISFSFDGNYLVLGSGSPAPGTREDDANGLEIYHVDAGELIHTVPAQRAITFAAWHPLRYIVAYAGDNGGLKIINPSNII